MHVGTETMDTDTNADERCSLTSATSDGSSTYCLYGILTRVGRITLHWKRNNTPLSCEWDDTYV